MAIAHAAEFGTNSSKTTGTTLAVSGTASPQPAVGDLIVVTCGRDDVASDPLTGDSISDGHGNTYTRVVLPSSTDATDTNAANACVGVVFWCVLTVAWSGSTTVTWTHPSLDARSMQVSHFTPTSGYSIELYDTATEGSILGNAGPLSTGAPVVEGDLVFAALAGETDHTVNVPADDVDTLAGSWTAMTKAGTTGGTATTNIWTGVQYKLTTAAATQSYTAGIPSGESALILLTFHERPTTGPGLVGVGAQVVSSTGSVTPTIHANAATGDLLLMVIGGRPSSNAADGVSIAGGSDGWAQHGSTSFREVGAVDLSVQVWWKIHDGSESSPTVSTNTVLAEAAATDRGFSAQIAVFRGMNASTPFDVTPVNSSSAAAATFAPTGVTTATNSALALSVVATADDNALDFNTSQSFRMAMGLADYDTTTGSDHAVGLAFKVISAAGAVTEPTWNESAGGGNDAWVGTSTALKPAGGDTTVNAGVATATGTANGSTVTVATNGGAGSSSGSANGGAGSLNATPAVAASTGAAGGPSPSLVVNVGTSAAAGTANSSASPVVPVAATAAAVGAAFDATVSADSFADVDAGLAEAAGAANNPTVTVALSAQPAAAVGAAPDPAVTASSNVSAGVAAATAAALEPSVTAVVPSPLTERTLERRPGVMTSERRPLTITL